jgi:hypothetical protein
MSNDGEKYWEERSDTEKIEVLRDELARACRVIEVLSTNLALIYEHRHAPDGSLLSPLKIEHHDIGRGGVLSHDKGTSHRIRPERERKP